MLHEAFAFEEKTLFDFQYDCYQKLPGSLSKKELETAYFGGGCFTCPGIRVESIAFGAMMHNIDPNKVVDEINALSD